MNHLARIAERDVPGYDFDELRDQLIKIMTLAGERK